MDDDTVREQIARLEAHIEVLSESIERCRKLALASKLAIGAGAALVVLMLLQVLPFAAVNMVGAIAAVIGGTVLYGSNASTWKQLAAALEQAQATRAELIERMALRVVEDSPPIH